MTQFPVCVSVVCVCVCNSCVAVLQRHTKHLRSSDTQRRSPPWTSFFINRKFTCARRTGDVLLSKQRARCPEDLTFRTTGPPLWQGALWALGQTVEDLQHHLEMNGTEEKSSLLAVWTRFGSEPGAALTRSPLICQFETSLMIYKILWICLRHFQLSNSWTCLLCTRLLSLNYF